MDWVLRQGPVDFVELALCGDGECMQNVILPKVLVYDGIKQASL